MTERPLSITDIRSVRGRSGRGVGETGVRF
jgi:hypothetical protein